MIDMHGERRLSQPRAERLGQNEQLERDDDDCDRRAGQGAARRASER
jgi:hypothetical protein